MNATTKLTHLSDKMIITILHDYRIYHADVLIREDYTVDDFIDVVLGNRKYIRCLYCYNKIDAISIEELDQLAREPVCLRPCCLKQNHCSHPLI